MEALVVIFGLFLYFLPSLIGGGKRNFTAIFLLNLLLGWTVIGWVIAIVWATTKDEGASPPAAAPASVEQIARLKALRDQGLLTQEEFMQQVGKL